MEKILYEWNLWWTKEYRFEGIEREALEDIVPWLKRKEIIAILGTRRAGKTTILYQIIDYLLKQKVNAKNILFIKADDDRIEKDNLIDTILNEYYKIINPKGKIFVFIDEIQESKPWNKTIKRIYDLNKEIKIMITGSNASIVKEELSTLLAGRYAAFEIFPFTFLEFLRAKKIEIKNKEDMFKQQHTIKHFLRSFIVQGSFPEICLEKDEKMKEELIHFYFDSIFYRDVIKRKNIRNPEKMEKLVKYYLQNIGNLANYTKIGSMVDLTTDSVGEYTKSLEDAYLIFAINLYEFSYKKQIINPKKIYCVDTGIRNIVGFRFSDDMGRYYENIVFMALWRKYKEIYYWKNNNECDFIVKKGRSLQAIQVCYNLKTIQTSQDREVKGLLEAMEVLKLREGIIVTDDHEGKEEINDKKVLFIPLWKWLLHQEGM